MAGTAGIVSRGSMKLRNLKVVLFLFTILLTLAPRVLGQTTTGALSGVVNDRDGASVPGATVVATNRANKFTSSTKANSDGVFTFPALSTGDYTLTITYKGFETFVVNTIHLAPGDTRRIDSIKLLPGNVDTTITVDASGRNQVEDTGERSSLITAKDLEKLSLEGREVTELLKILPGSAINNGIANNGATSNKTFDPGNVTFGGAAGSYSMSGSPTNGVAIRSDGANLTDPGSGSSALQTVNAESTAEVKIQTANFGADSANGPLVINAVGKSGGSDYHGKIYAYGRTNQLNSEDSIANFLGVHKPSDRYIYPGASLGGPIKIPGTNINHDKKLVFFVNGEDYIQRNTYAYNDVASALQTALVPTPNMLKGDFSYGEISKYLPPGIPVCVPTDGSPCRNIANDSAPAVCDGTSYCGAPGNLQNVNAIPVGDLNGNLVNCNGNTGNDCLSGRLDPGALAQFTLFPSPNEPLNLLANQPVCTPTLTTGPPDNGPNCNDLNQGHYYSQTLPGAYNYTHQNLADNDIYQAHGRLDYNRSDREKFYMTFTAENGTTTVPQGENYYQSGNSGGLNTPGGTKRSTYTYSGSANWNATFTTTLTNEFFVSGLYSNRIDAAGQPAQLFNSAIGYPYGGAYDNKTKQFPNLLDYGFDGLPVSIFPDYSYGDLFNKAFVPGGGDNLTKLIGKHTIKIGVNVERALINGSLVNVAGTSTNGSISDYYTNPTFSLPDPSDPTGQKYLHYHTSCYKIGSDTGCALENGHGNQLANYLSGSISNYSQANSIPAIKAHAWTISQYVTDDWKVTKNLSVTAGVRIDHIGRWNDDHGFGAAVFDPATYQADGLGSAADPLPGFRWHAIDSSIPLGGFKTREFFYQPRFGFNWDVYGDGKTSLSGGWGQYRFRDGQADAINALQGSNGLRTVNISNPGIQAFDPYNTNPNFPCAMCNGPSAADLFYSSLNQAGLTMAYVSRLHINPSPGSEASTFVTTGNGGYPSTSQTFYGVDRNDDEAPLTTNYNATVTQQMGLGLVMSVAYVGNNSNYLLNDNSGGGGITTANINALPVGALFQPNPNPQSTQYGITFLPSSLNYGLGSNDWRKYPHYSGIQVENHLLTANYNGLQVILNHQKGAVYFQLNYTFSKNMGVKGGFSNGNAGDSFNNRNNYGPLAYDRTQIFNASYNFDLGSKYHGFRPLRPVLNGWQISGITNFQSGPNLQATNYNTDFGLGGYIPATPVQQTYPINNTSYLGTPDVSLQPLLTCDPRTNLKPRQFMRNSCFALPAQGGQNGPMTFPYIHGPAFFQSDLTLVKDFKLKEKQGLQFRLAAFNFLNYKLKTFSSKDNRNPLTLVYPLENNPSFGISTLNSGRRVLELALLYSF
jgi:hypothetical protein